MSYTPDDRNLAHLTKMLPADAMQVWCDAANEAAAMGLDHNGCVRKGWDEVGKGWMKPADAKPWPNVSKWVKKESPEVGDVHVNAPLGSDSKKPKRKRPMPMMGDEDTMKFETSAQVCKVDQSLGLVFGWAIVCNKSGQPYFDLQNDHIPEDAMLKAAADFMENSRVAKDMHQGDEIGPIVFAWPMTEEIAKSLGITTRQTGLLIAMKPGKDVLGKFADGSYSGFSIGGSRLEDEEVAA